MAPTTRAPDAQNRILIENYYLPGDLEAQIEAFVEHYCHGTVKLGGRQLARAAYHG
jgi:hypothetical protein